MDGVISRFLSQQYGQCEGCSIGITTLPARTTRWFPSTELDKLLAYAEDKGRKTDTYLDVFPRKNGLSANERGSNDDVTHVTCVFADFDIRDGVHADENLPSSVDEVLDVIHGLEELPSFIFSTGHGVHAYWMFADPFAIVSEADRKLAMGVVSGYVGHLAGIFGQHGWNLDPVGDLARMMRFPLSLNFKSEPHVPGCLIEETGVIYSFEDFIPYARELADSKKAASDIAHRPSGSADRMIERCAFLGHLKEHPETIPEPLWFMGISNIALAKDGEEKCHEISRGVSGILL